MRRLLPIVFCLLPVLLASQSPWARSKAGFYAQLGYHTIPTYTTLFGENSSDLEMIREVSEHTVQLYGEYGLTDRTTAALSLPYRINSRGARNPDNPMMFAQEDTGTIAGLGNITLALRHQFLTGRLALGGQLQVGFPSDLTEAGTGLRTGYDTWAVQPTVNVGMGLGRIFWQAYTGFTFRTNNYSHLAQAGVEGGLRLGKVWVIGFSQLVLPLENGSRPVPPLDVLTGLYVNDQGWLSIGLKGIWEISEHVGLVVSGAGAAWAQYVPQSPGLSAAVYVKWD